MSHPMRYAGVTTGLSPQAAGKGRPLSMWMLTACGVWLMGLNLGPGPGPGLGPGLGLGLCFIFLRPPLLPEDPRFMGTTVEQIRMAVPGLESWLNEVLNRAAPAVVHERGNGGVN